MAVLAIFIVGSRNTAARPRRRATSRKENAGVGQAASGRMASPTATRRTAPRYARLDQIDASNVGGLKEIWHYRTGRAGQFKATPLQIGDLLYVCTAMNVVVALDAETGAKRWGVRSPR